MNIEELFKNNINPKVANNSVVGNFVYKAAELGQQDRLFGVPNVEKYTKAGITPVVGENMDEYLPETQSAMTKLGNGIAQTLVSEIALGIPKGFADLVNIVGNAIMRNNGDYNNPVSKFLEQKQEEFKEFAPVYVDPKLNISNGGLTDMGWWASNLPSIVSSITLMLPGAAVTKGVRALAKIGQVGARTKAAISAISGAAKRVDAGKKLNKFQKFINSDELAKGANLFAENVTTAAISRTIENYQEGRQVYNDMYVQATEYFKDDKQFSNFVKRNEEDLDNAKIDKNDKNAVAKYVANKSADETFKLDYLNTAFDVIQLYSLKNAWKNIRNAPETSRKIKMSNKDAAARIGKSSEDIAKIEEGISKATKFKNWALNKTTGQAKIIGAELSEGVEEAVNYIAQEEGMTFGNILLTGEGTYSGFWERIANGFDNRLDSYMNSPQLWDSAFWGFLGGVTFQNLGSGTKRLYNTIAARAADKQSEEVNAAKKPWYWLEQLPEVKRRIADINSRNDRYLKYKDDLAKIDKGIDVFQEPQFQAEGQLNSDILKEAARNRAFNDYITDVTMSAIDNGNFDLLREYFQDENLRKAMIESGIFQGEGKNAAEIEQESKDFVANAVKKMDEVADQYDTELMHLNNITLSKKFKGNVPQEVISIIARDNIKYKQAIDQQNEAIGNIDADIAKEKANLIKDPSKPQLDESVQYERAIRLITIGHQLGALRAQRKKIAAEPDSIGQRIALSNIDNQIDIIEKDLSDEELYYTTADSLRVIDVGEGKYSSVLTDEFFDFYNNIIIGNPNAKNGKVSFDKIDTTLLHLSPKVLLPLNDTSRQSHKLLEQDARETVTKLKGISENLNSLYEQKAAAEISKQYLTTFINKNVDSVAKRVGEIKNILHGARNTAINKKGVILDALYVKHGNIIRDIIRAEFEGNTKQLKTLYSQLDSNTVTTIKDCLKVFDFTKSYNQNIAAELENGFDEIDRIEKAKEEKAKKNMEVDSSTDSKDNSASQNLESKDSSSNTTNNNTNEQNELESITEQQISPQQTEKIISNDNDDVVENNTEDEVPEIPLITNDNSSSQNSKSFKAKVLYNEDPNPASTNTKVLDKELNMIPIDNGEYEIIDEDLSILNIPGIFDTNGIDLTRPYEIKSKPIVEKTPNGFRIVNRGKIVNTDTQEYQDKKTKEEEDKKSQNPSTGDSDKSSSQRQDFAPPIPPSKVAEDRSFNPDLEDMLKDRHLQELMANDKVRSMMMTKWLSYENKKDFNIEEEFNAAVDYFVSKGEDRELYEAGRKAIVSLFTRLSTAKKKNVLESSTDELIIETGKGIYENKQNNTLKLDFTTKVKQLIEAYCDEFGIPTVNGKKYINFEDLLRFLNSMSEDKLTSSIIYYGLNEYLKTDEAKQRYIRTDELGDDTIEANCIIDESENDRYIEQLNASNPQRINMDASAIEETLGENIQDEIDESFASINSGDEITYEIQNNKIIFKAPNGKIIGSNALPIINPTTGVRTMAVANFIYDLDKTSNGTLKSKLRDLIFKWLSDESDDIKDLRSILYALTYENKTKAEKEELYNQFINNPEVKQAIADGLIADISDNLNEIGKTINHLSKLFKYRNFKNTFDTGQLKDSIDAWFDKVYENYESAIYLSDHPNTKIQVSNISDGKIIRNQVPATKKTSIPVQEAIAGGINPSVNKLTVTNDKHQTMVSGSYPVSMNFKPGSTHVIIPNRNGSKEYVQAFPSTVKDSFIGKDAKAIVKELRKHLKKLINNYANEKTADNYNALKRFLLDAFDYNNNTCLFFGARAFVDRSDRNNEVLVFQNKDSKLKLRINLSEDTIEVFNNNETGQKLPINDNKILSTITKIIDGLNFDIIAKGKFVNSDKRSEDANIKGLVSKRSNKFTIKIGDKTWSYNSFNEFVLNNNLVSLNTHPNKVGTSNFERTDMTSLEYKIVREKPSTPIEDNETFKPVVIPLNMSKADKALGILNESIPTKHKGEALFSLFKEVDGKISDEDLDALKSLKEFGLLPENIIFDENFNKNDKVNNAKTDINTGQVTVGTKWLSLFNYSDSRTAEQNQSSRSYAIRVLIHERIHQIIHSKKNQGYVKSLKDVFNEFKNSINRDNVKYFLEYFKEKQGIPKDKIVISEEEITKWIEQINSFKYDQYNNEDVQLEEFLVDSLMNNNLIEYLNSVQTDLKRKGGKNLFQKIIELLNEIFGWNIEKGSLREKEFYALRNTFNIPKTSKKETPKTTISKKRLFTQPMLPHLFDESEDKQDDNKEDKPETQFPKQDEAKQDKDKQDESSEEEVIVDEASDNELTEEDLADPMSEDDSFEDVDESLLGNDENSPFSSTDELEVETFIPEMQSIKQQAIADGTFMKAPNGNPTNLNERQWLQVRTKAFKDWFGDWENNPSKASKVVDENGEPLVVYHGTIGNEEFYTFNTKIDKKLGQIYGKGSYFTPSHQIALKYTGDRGDNFIKSVFLNIKNPFIDDIFLGNNPEDTTKQIQNNSYDGRWIVTEYNKNILNRIPDMFVLNEEKDYITSLDEILVFNSNQIKFATSNTGEFSTTNDDIRYSSTDELTIDTSSSFLDAQSQLPIELRSNFASMVNSAVIRSQCK